MGKFNFDSVTVETVTPRPVSIDRAVSARIVSAALAILLGGAILFVAGFSSNNFVHAAAHDVRHATGFPCH
ncbi:MAG: CbtB-domain containing protein [Candidatus Binataceae bacterium]|nr:CbtB-domain containing protein [Candidatus Binataceae bacterium]